MKTGDRVVVVDNDFVMVDMEVVITNPKSVRHFAACAMPITGKVIEIDHNHIEGRHRRPVKVRFDDGRETWWGMWELKVAGTAKIANSEFAEEQDDTRKAK